jgi:hypothetical protein
MVDPPILLSEVYSSCNLFIAPGSKPLGNLRCGLYGRLLQESSCEFFSYFTFHALTYHYLIIVITRKHLKVRVIVVDLRSAVATLDSIFAAQAGYSTYINH